VEALAIAQFFTKIVTVTWQSSHADHFPSEWKAARVIPLFKKFRSAVYVGQLLLLLLLFKNTDIATYVELHLVT
jgi:hypothetical protein